MVESVCTVAVTAKTDAILSTLQGNDFNRRLHPLLSGRRRESVRFVENPGEVVALHRKLPEKAGGFLSAASHGDALRLPQVESIVNAVAEECLYQIDTIW
jgi:hypothetical protein